MTTDLTYVKDRLNAVGMSEWHAVHKATKINIRTLRRIASGDTPAPRSDTVGKILWYFRTKEHRAR